jgi:hypothetical protein
VFLSVSKANICDCGSSDSYDEHFNRVISIVPLIERINAVHLESVATTRVAMPSIPFPDLHKEVFEKP